MHLVTEPIGIRWVSWSRQGGSPARSQCAGEQRWDRHDHVARTELVAVGRHDHTVVVLGDPPRRCRQHHRAGQALGEAEGEQLGPTTIRSSWAPSFTLKSRSKSPPEWL